jgi:hypothetical protein
MRPHLTILAALMLCAGACSDESAPSLASSSTPVPAAASPAGTTPAPAATREFVVPALPVPDAEDVLANGRPVGFKLCRLISNFERPPFDAIRDILTDPRFGDGVRPHPFLFTYYLSSFIYDPIPTAASGDTQRLGFSGVTYNLDRLETFCTESELRSVGADSAWVTMESVGYRVTAAGYRNDSVVLRAEPDPGTWQSTVFPYPPQPRSVMSFSSVQVVGPSGVKLYEYSTGDQWHQRIHYDEAGNLVYVVMGTAASRDSTPVVVPAAGATLDLFAPGADGALTIFDTDGAEVASVAWNRGLNMWQPVETLTLQPGTYTLRCHAQGGNWCEITLIAEGQPLPP